MPKDETIINKDDLFSYLDAFLFGNSDEIIMAICEYIEKQEGVLYWSDSMLANELANEYINKKELYNIDYKVDGETVDFTEGF